MNSVVRFLLIAFFTCLVCLGCSKPQAKLTGLVVDGLSGEPIPGVKVVATTQTDIVEEKEFATLAAETGPDGKFSITTPLANRSYRLEMTKEYYSDANASSETPDLEQTREIDSVNMFRFPDVTGTVLAAFEGTPLEGCKVSLGDKETTTDATGAFKFQTVPPGGTAILAQCANLTRETSLYVDKDVGVQDVGQLLVSSIPDSKTGIWSKSTGSGGLSPINSEHTFSKWFQSVSSSDHQGAATELNSRQGRINAEDVVPELRLAPTLPRGSILVSRSSDLYAAPVFHSAEAKRLGESSLSPDDYFIATDGYKPYVHPYYGGVSYDRQWYFNRRMYSLSSFDELNVDQGKLRLYRLDVPAGLYCLGRPVFSDRLYVWTAKSGCVLIFVK